MSDMRRAMRRRVLASIGGLAATTLAPPTFCASTRASTPDERFETIDLAAPPPPALRRALDPLRGRAVLVNFWATWCEPCRTEMPALVSLDEAEPAIGLVTVAVADRMDEVRRFFADHLVDPIVVADPEQVISRAWNISYLPTTLLLDAAHQPRLRVRGEIDWHADAVRARIRAFAGKAPTHT